MKSAEQAQTTYPIHELIASRWSPVSFSSRPVPPDDLRSIFEAARWAPSCFNEQPWRYIVAQRDEEEAFSKILSCLTEPNQVWAKQAPVLVLGTAKSIFSKNGKTNRWASHDLGQATANLAIEATARGLFVHQMGGIRPERAREIFSIPEEYEVVTGIAIGYAGDPEDLPENLRTRDLSARTRRPLSETVFAGKWGRGMA